MTALPWRYDDGGRAEAGFHGSASDCVVRSIAIATKLPYHDVYDELNDRLKTARAAMRKNTKKYRGALKSGSRLGMPNWIYRPYLLELGWEWWPAMSIGSGTQVHLADDELLGDRLIVRVSKHLCAVINNVVHDTHDPSRDGTRAVYGYFYEK